MMGEQQINLEPIVVKKELDSVSLPTTLCEDIDCYSEMTGMDTSEIVEKALNSLFSPYRDFTKKKIVLKKGTVTANSFPGERPTECFILRKSRIYNEDYSTVFIPGRDTVFSIPSNRIVEHKKA